MSKSIDEIASALGVSVTTIKLVINGKADKYRIARKTQSKIKAYISEHGYRINQAARNLRLKKSETLGLVLPNLANPYFLQLAEYLGDLCQAKNYQLITVSTKSDPFREKRLTDTLLSRGVDGMFIVSTSAKRQQNIQFEAKNKPLVFLDRNFQSDDLFSVTSDNFQGSLQMTLKLLEHCENDFFFLYGDPVLPSIYQRIAGFIEACHRSGRELDRDWGVSVALNTKRYGYRAMETLYRQNNGKLPAALLFSSLPILEGALLFVRAKYAQIPKEIILATFDDHSMLNFLPNMVLSVQQNSEIVAENALRMMLAQLHGESLRSHKGVVVATKLILRNQLMSQCEEKPIL